MSNLSRVAYLVLLAFYLVGCDQSGGGASKFYQAPPPHILLANIKKMVRGGEVLSIDLSGIPVEMRAISDIRVEYSVDKVNFLLLSTLPGTALTYDWSVPKIDAKEALLKVVYSDLSGKRSETLSNVFEIRSRLPLLTLSNPPREDGELKSMLVQGTCETDLPITPSLLSGTGMTLPASIPCNGGTWSQTITNSGDGLRDLRFKQVDEVGHEKEVFFTWSTQTVLPQVDSSYFQVENGASITPTNYVKVNFRATDNTRVTHFCLLYNPTNPPSATDNCWQPVDGTPPGQSATAAVQFSNYFYRLGFAKGSYTVRGYARDYAGNVSLSYGEKTIQYLPPTPPDVSHLIASNTAAPLTLSNSETTVAKNQNVFIKWKAVNTDLSSTFLSAPINLYYTTDNVNWTLIASGVSNSSNAGCVVNHAGTSLDDQATGCYIWSSQVNSGYFRIRVQVTNQVPGRAGELGATIYGQTNALNLTNFKFLAGNTEAGLGGIATKAMFFPKGKQAFVVHPSGRIFVNDERRGIVTVDPVDGNAKTYIASGSTIIDGQVGTARIKNVSLLALDHQGNIVMMDDDRIRRIRMDQSPVTVETIIGGGTSLADVVEPRDLQIVAKAQGTLLTALPNGDLYFLSDQFAAISGTVQPTNLDYKIRFLDHLDGKVKAFQPKSDGITSTMNGDAITEIEKCALTFVGVQFDPITSLAKDMLLTLNRTETGACQKVDTLYNTPRQWADYVFLDPQTKRPLVKKPENQYTHGGPAVGIREYAYFINPSMSGKVYSMASTVRGNSKVTRLEGDGKWTTVLGHGTRGICADGTDALSCAVTVSSIFVDAKDSVYFMDRQTIRLIQEDGKVLTLAGQRPDYGDGQNPLNARFSNITSFDLYRDGMGQDQFSVVDANEYRIRKFSENGMIETVAGNGIDEVDTANATGPAAGKSISFGADAPSPFLSIDPVNGNIWTLRIQNNTPFYLNASGSWVKHGTASAAGYGPMVLANQSSKVLVGTYSFCGTTGTSCNSRLYEYDKTTGVRTTLLTQSANTTLAPFCADGTPLSNCISQGTGNGTAALAQGQYDSFHSAWLLKERNSRRIVKLDNSGVMKTLVTLPDPEPLVTRKADDFVYFRSNTGAVEKTFYCNNGKIYKYDHLTSTNTLISYPVASMSCPAVGRMIYNSDRNSLMFIYNFQGLPGIAEIQNP